MDLGPWAPLTLDELADVFDGVDHVSLLPVISAIQRRWLADHLAADHPWQAQL